MYVIIKIDIGIEIHSSIISVCDSFKQALNECNNYMTSIHDEEKDVIYRDSKNRFAHYIRGYVYGRTLKTIYEIVKYQQIETPHHQGQQYEEIFLNCPRCHNSVDYQDEATQPLSS